MPKRTSEEKIEFLSKGLKELERNIRRARGSRRLSESSSASSCSKRTSSRSSSSSSSSSSQCAPLDPEYNNDRDIIAPAHEDALPRLPPPPPVAAADPTASTSNTMPSIVNPVPTVPDTIETNELAEEDICESELLDILGADPSTTQEYGEEINKEVASRFEYIATNGLDKQVRQDLMAKYLVPSNCTNIAAPLLNAEIKAALTETVIKRDKAIEYKQKQVAAAITGISRILTSQLKSKEKDNNLPKQLMEIGRILCDIQHSESMSRRSHAMYPLKKEFREQLANTKIDKYLFGVNLPDTLKTAKAVCKSGTDLKMVIQKPKQAPRKPVSKNLNWKTGPSARNQQQKGPMQKTQPAAPVSRRENSSHRSSHRHKTTRRR